MDSIHFSKNELMTSKGQLTLPLVNASELPEANRQQLNQHIAQAITKLNNQGAVDENPAE